MEIHQNRGEHEGSSVNSVEVLLSQLHPNIRTGNVFEQSTRVEIQKKESGNESEYSVMIAEPLRSGVLKRILEGSSDEKFDSSITIYYLRNDIDEFGGKTKPYLRELGQLLEMPDDTGFVNDIVRNLNSRNDAWKNAVGSQGFAELLVRDFGSYSARYFQTAKFVTDFLISRSDLLTAEERGRGMNRRMLIERFGRLPIPMRETIIDLEMSQIDRDLEEEKSNRINDIDNLNFMTEIDDETWYFTGRWDDVIGYYPKNMYFLRKGDNQAVIAKSDEGFKIHPRSAFLVPTISWKVDRSGKHLVVPSQFEKSEIVKNIKNKPGVTIHYQLQDGHKSNSVVGLTVLQYILDYPHAKGIPPEYAPELALLRRRDLLRSDFIKKAEQLIAK